MTTILTAAWTSPLGRLELEGDGMALLRIRLPGERRPPTDGRPRRPDRDAFIAVIAQLDEYFAGTRRTFDLPLAPAGTPFQQKVWELLREIPWGQTISYAELARRSGNPAASRAVGAANGRNPLPIVVPCHRVIGSNGTLTGYAGGLAAKRALLAVEGIAVAQAAAAP